MGLGALSCNMSEAVVRAKLVCRYQTLPEWPRLPPVFSTDEADVYRIELIISYRLA